MEVTLTHSSFILWHLLMTGVSTAVCMEPPARTQLGLAWELLCQEVLLQPSSLLELSANIVNILG